MGNIDVEKRFSDDIVIQADPVELQQVFLNILINAVQAMEGRAGSPLLPVFLINRESSRSLTLAGGSQPSTSIRFSIPFSPPKGRGPGPAWG
jgi:signal transduction histidine kinase